MSEIPEPAEFLPRARRRRRRSDSYKDIGGITDTGGKDKISFHDVLLNAKTNNSNPWRLGASGQSRIQDEENNKSETRHIAAGRTAETN